MTDEELLTELTRLPRDWGEGAYLSNWDHDEERSHSQADNLLVQVLRSLGFKEAMDFYSKQKKWYA